ncbi:MAG: hypothetical protein LBR36_06395 [Bacteroidales bacterium]|nr:hypothetical protein [Bacteroidales bacterium]
MSSSDSLYVEKTIVDNKIVHFELALAYNLNLNDKDTIVYPSYRATAKDTAYGNFPYFHDKIFQNKASIDDKLRFFIIPEDTMLKYNWSEICQRQLYEKKNRCYRRRNDTK